MLQVLDFFARGARADAAAVLVPSLGRSGRRWWWTVGSATVLSIALAPILTMTLHRSLLYVLYDGGPVENIQALIWVGAAVLWGVAAFQPQPRWSRGLCAWAVLFSMLCFARELDLHEYLNPRAGLGVYGVHFRIDWFLKGRTSYMTAAEYVPVWIRLGWALIFIVTGGALLVPVVRTHRENFWLLRRGDVGVMLMLGCAGWLAVGYLMDDQFGRDRFMSDTVEVGMEETAELIGPVWFLFAALVRGRFFGRRKGDDVVRG
ncbi:hypothetical protein BH11PLA1_BH11PLA1_19880 [soil metagenome]